MSVKDYSLPEFAERKEIVYFNPDTPLNVPQDGASQEKSNITFTISDRGSLYDYANGYFDIDVRLELKTDAGGRSYTSADNASIICGIHSLIRRIDFYSQTGASIYTVDMIDKAVFLRKLLEMSPDYAESVADNEYWILDKTVDPNDANIDPITGVAGRGHQKRKTFWSSPNVGTPVKVRNFRIPLKWFSYFQALDWGNVMFTGMSPRLVITLNNDDNLIYRQGGGEGRVVVEKMRLALPQIKLRPNYYEEYIKFISSGSPIRWTYLRERVDRSQPTTTKDGQYKITSVYRPKEVFIYFLTDAKEQNQLLNPYVYDNLVEGYIGAEQPTPNGIGSNAKCTRARLEFSDGTFYPHVDYIPTSQLARIYGDVLEYGHVNDDKSSGTQLTRSQFKVNSCLYFNLQYKADPLVSDTKDMTFVYNLEADTVDAYRVVAIIFQEHEASYGMVSGNYELTDEVKR